MEDATPKPKFSFAWVDDNNADVFVTIKGDDQVFRIGLLCWVNDTWLFQRITPKNEQVGGGAFCCDEEKEAEFREREAQTRVESAVAPYSVLQARLAALSIEREQYRDDSREIAESGATLQARKWWRQFWHELNEYDD